jgi:hypothetical protein
LRSHFSADLRPRVRDVTPLVTDYDGPHLRWQEIRAWLALHPQVERHATLDDQDGWFPESWRAHAVYTDPATGLTRDDLTRLRRLLAQR